MTTQSWSTVIDHTTDAGFRTWGAEVNTKLVACGWVQTADTGQINWASVTRAGTNSDAGYECYYLNDSLHGSAPIYIKLYYGTGSSTSKPRVKLEVGTSTNGSGTIGGTAKTAATDITSNSNITSTVTSYQSYACLTNGVGWMVYKYGGASAGQPLFSFAIVRSVDATGAPTVTGALVLFYASSGTGVTPHQSLRFASTAIAYTVDSTNSVALVPGNQATSSTGSDTQAYLCWMITPQVTPVLAAVIAYLSEIALGNTFSGTFVGSTSHTYIQVSNALGTCWKSSTTNSTLLGLALMWE